MKLHKLKLVNLNALYGEHTLDFERDLDGAAIFLISGPTGAGKSTLLDAVCVALFGRTPRLNQSHGRADTDPALLMSFGAAHCAASVEFSLRRPGGERDRYRAIWECRRARGRADGKLQPPTRTLQRILPDGTEEIIVSDHRQKFFEEHFALALRGLSVEDFQRSVLLAQGEFAAFLHAGEGDKARILERLTNTDLYRRLGQRAQERFRDAQSAARTLQAQRDAIALLPPEEEEALRVGCAALEAEARLAREAAAQAERGRDWLRRHAALEEARRAADAELADARLHLQARARDAQRLDEDARCRNAQPLLAGLEGAAGRLGEAEAALPDAEAALSAALALEAERAEARREAARTAEEAEAALLRARPQLERAAALQHHLAQARAALDDAAARHAAEERDQAAAQDAQRRAEAEALAAQEARQAAQEALEGLAFAADLVERLAGLEARLEALSASWGRAAQAQDRLNAAQAAADAAARDAQEAADARDAAQRRLAPLQDSLQRAADQLDDALDGQPDPPQRRAALQRLRDDAAQRAERLRDACRVAARRDQLQRELERAAREDEAQQAELERARARLVSAERELEGLESAAEAQDRALRRLDRELALADARRELRADEPCPLCGSAEHPFLHDPDGVDALELERRRERDALLRRHERTREDIKTLTAERRDLERATTRLNATADERTRALDHLRRDLDALPAPTQEDPDAALAAAEADALRLQARLDDLAARLDAAAQAREDLRAAEAGAAEIHRRADTLHERADALRRAAQDAAEHLNTLQREAQDAAALLAADLPTPPADLTREALEESLRLARQDRDAWRAAQRAAEAAAQRADAAQRALLAAAPALQRAAHRLDEAARARQAAAEHLDTLQSELETLFQGRPWEQLQADLERARDHARADRESTAATLAAAQEATAAARARYEERLASRDRARQTFADAAEALRLALAQLGLRDADTLRARLLDEDTRRDLADALRDARERLGRAEAAHEVALHHLDEHAARCPDLGDLASIPLDALDDEVHQRTAAAIDLAERYGAQRTQLRAQEDARARADEADAGLHAANRTLAIWSTLNALIGRSGGEHFQRFAQSLNLQELVNRANARLHRLAPRYRLAVARGAQEEPLLDFVVRDREMADAERPITTLSGGETFLVSLALALALADFRRVEMQVETLLLDEGFGTLDHETLDLAMGTLRQLQREAALQIGLISHVDALRERVEDQILVERLGNGRSALRVERAGR